MFYWFMAFQAEDIFDIIPWLNGLPETNTGRKAIDGMYEGFVVDVEDLNIFFNQKDNAYIVIAKCQCRRYNRKA